MAAKRIWLNSLLFKKTKDLMQLSSKELSEYIENNLRNKIQSEVEQIVPALKKHICNKTDSILLNEIRAIIDDKSWSWKQIDILKRIHKIIDANPQIKISQSNYDELEKYTVSYELKTGYSEPAIKKKAKYENSTNPLINEDVFIYYALVPYFSDSYHSENHKGVDFMEYMRFLEDSKNLISTGNNTVRIDNIDDIVKSYTDIYEYNYNETSFIKMMKALFGMLLKMSKQADSGLFEDRNILMADIIGIYKKHMPFDVNTYSYFYGGATTGMSFDVLDSILEDAAEATITLYRHISKKYRYSWEECLDNRGFMGQMLYFLYYRMNKQDIKMLKLMSKTIQDNARKKYGTFIDMKADISPKAFISNNCDIRKAKVGDDVFMANCMLNDNSEIKNGCTIDALYTTVEAGVIVKPETVIKGEIFVHIKKDA